MQPAGGTDRFAGLTSGPGEPGDRSRVDVFGTMPDGAPVRRARIGRAPGLVVELLELGASVHRVEVSLPGGERRNLALGFASVADRLAAGHYLGATVGRYANRIAGGGFALDGVAYRLVRNDRGHTLHGGPDGYDVRGWQLLDAGPDEAVLELVSPAGDQGFPGRLVARARYVVGPDTLRVEYTATVDAPSPVNLTSHVYWNLDGEGAPTVDDHLLSIPAAAYTPIDSTSIPAGEHAPVSGTPFDLRVPGTIGTVVRTDHVQIRRARGLDHNFVVGPVADRDGLHGDGLDADGLRDVCVLESVRGGLRLTLRSDQPGLQVYTGNGFDGTLVGTSGRLYRQGAGIALEPQRFPDSPNRPHWPDTVLRPDQTYHNVIEARITSL